MKTSPPNESFVELNNRVEQFIKEKILLMKKGNIVLFSHGGPIRSAINIVLEIKKLVLVHSKLTTLRSQNFFNKNNGALTL